jgi:hypothetical protein
MQNLLVMTVGQTDVQLVVDNQKRKFEGNRCGRLHDEIIRHRTWTVVDTPSQRSREMVSDLPDGELRLCTPKLDAVLRSFGDSLPTSAIIFETTREDDRDPRHSGLFLSKRLNDRGVKDVERFSYLTGTATLESSENDRDSVVRHSIVEMLSDAVRKQIKKLGKEDRVFVATTGGLAAANDLINELVRLHAVNGPTVTALEVPDVQNDGIEDRAVQEKFHPSAGLRARWHALSLIERGNLLGAWGAVCHLEGKPGQQWTKVVKWLADFASSLPIPEDCDIEILKDKRMAVRAAIRVELSLRARDIPRAVHGTVAFFEAALWDGLNDRIARSTDPKRRRLFRVKDGEPPQGVKLLRQGNDRDSDRKCPFEFKDRIDGVDWYWVHEGEGGPSARLAEYFLKRTGLRAFDRALESNIELLSLNFRGLRNDVAHNEPTPELMQSAEKAMVEANLWSDNGGLLTFLGQKLVKDVLNELNVCGPGEVCANLLKEVRERLTVLS